MREFKAMDWFHLAGYGDVATVVNDEDFQKDSRHLLGETVKIDGQEYTVIGVEAPAIMTVRKGAGIGLMVGARQIETGGNAK